MPVIHKPAPAREVASFLSSDALAQFWGVDSLANRPRKVHRSLCAGGTTMLQFLWKVWNDDKGQDIAEYALMLTVILLIVAATVQTIGTNAEGIFSNVANKLTTG
jgi:Flp pilus assembly pilin Flp